MDPSRPEAVEPGKLFVGGLSWETTADSLKKYFMSFGEVTDSVIMRENTTKKHRGFGFVTFRDPESVNKVMRYLNGHIVDGKKVDPKPATAKGHQNMVSTKKIFVGGLGHNTSEDDVKTFFSKFGTVTDVDLKVDKQTNRMRGFGFVGFLEEEAVKEAVKVRYHQLADKRIEAKLAEPRYGSGPVQQVQQPYAGNFHGGNYGGYSRGPGQQQQQYEGTQYYAPYQSGYQYPAGGQGSLSYYDGYGGSATQPASASAQQMGSYNQDPQAPFYQQHRVDGSGGGQNLYPYSTTQSQPAAYGDSRAPNSYGQHY